MEYTIVLVMLRNMQAYIMDNLEHLLHLGNRRIVVLTDAALTSHFVRYVEQGVSVVAVETFYPAYHTMLSQQQNTFRDGFWFLTSFRFPILQAYMAKYNVINVIHVENDVMLYVNVDNELTFHCDNRILLTMDNKHRVIPGFMYIPNNELLGNCLKFFTKGLNDMQNWGSLFHKPAAVQYVDTLPIAPYDETSIIRKFVTLNFPRYRAVFDAAAIGQYIGGIDPRNTPHKNTVGFINETCVINYQHYNITYQDNRPYLALKNGGETIPIVCLHIHCKNLKAFKKLPPVL
jgi:hypothetical protein